MKNRHHTRLSMPSRYASVHKTQKNLWITSRKWLQILALQFFTGTWQWCLQAVGIVQIQIKFRNECDIDFIVATFAVSKLDALVSCIHILVVFVQIKLFLFLYTFTSIPSADIKISEFLKRSFAKACETLITPIETGQQFRGPVIMTLKCPQSDPWQRCFKVWHMCRVYLKVQGKIVLSLSFPLPIVCMMSRSHCHLFWCANWLLFFRGSWQGNLEFLSQKCSPCKLGKANRNIPK